MVRQYVGARYVPKIADPVEWQADTAYEALVIVTYNSSSYTSRKPVPATVGIPPQNSEYWALTGNYNAQVEEYRQLTEQAVETANTANSTANKASEDVGTLTTTVEGFDERITDNSSDIKYNEGQITTLKNELQALTGRVNELETEIGDADVNYANTYIVHKNSETYNTISSAIEQAKTDQVSLSNPKVILVYPGDYNEQIILNDVHGLYIVGVSRESVILHYNGSYPDCVIHAQGDVSFANMTIRLDNATTYAIHCDPVDTSVTGKLSLIECNIVGGTNAIGYGSGNNTELYVNGCTLSASGEACIYAHNSAYSGRSGQKLTLLNNLFKLTGSSQYVLSLDDAGNTNGVSSVMNCLFANNSHDYAGYAKIKFRKNTSSGSPTGYVPRSDSNILVRANCKDNAGIPGMNYNEAEYVISGFVLFPPNADTGGLYVVTTPVPVDTRNYTGKLINATLPGVGDITSTCSIDGFYGYGINVTCNNSACAGKTISVTCELYCN